MSTPLEPAVAQLYAVFGRHPRPARMQHCPHCVDPDEVAVLLRVPLRELTAEQVRRYAAKAVTTWGGTRELRHFLPRLLELLAAGAFDDPVASAGLLGAVGDHWHGWPADERRAVEAYLPAWWAATLAHYPAPVEVAEVLAAIGRCGVDVGPYLATWASDGGKPAARHLADHLYAPPPDDGRPWSRAVRAWLAGPEPGRMLEAALLTASTDRVAREISDAYELLAHTAP